MALTEETTQDAALTTAAPETVTIFAEADFCDRKLTTKELGEMVELRLMAKASAEKFRVLKPWGDSARY